MRCFLLCSLLVVSASTEAREVSKLVSLEINQGSKAQAYVVDVKVDGRASEESLFGLAVDLGRLGPPNTEEGEWKIANEGCEILDTRQTQSATNVAIGVNRAQAGYTWIVRGGELQRYEFDLPPLESVEISDSSGRIEIELHFREYATKAYRQHVINLITLRSAADRRLSKVSFQTVKDKRGTIILRQQK